MGETQEQLPGMERRDLPEIEQAADRYRKVRDERCALSKREAEAKSALIQVMLKAGRSFYSYNGLTVELSNVENVKVKSNKDEDDEQPMRPRKAAAAADRDVRIEEQSETQQETEPESEPQAQVVICTCDHPGDDHEENGACGWDACDCDGFTPKVNDASDVERDRVHREAVARWRRERPGSAGSVEAEEDNGGTPFPTEYPQAEINRMAEFCAADRIGDKKKSVKICYVSGQPHVITGAIYQGQNCLSVDAWPVLPLANVGEAAAKTYEEASKEHSEALNAWLKADLKDQEGPRLEYLNMKINCGSVKKPDWWVMVGPEITFTVDYSADYQDFETSAPPEDDQANTAQVFGELQEQAGSAVESDQAEDIGAMINAALSAALHSHEGAAERWQPLIENGATDAELMAAISLEFGGRNGWGGSSVFGGHERKGGKSPEFIWLGHGAGYEYGERKFKGKRLLAIVREVMGIGAPGQAAAADQEGIYRCLGCGDEVDIALHATDGKCSRCWTPDDIKDPVERAAFIAENSIDAPSGMNPWPYQEDGEGDHWETNELKAPIEYDSQADDFTAERCDECLRIDGGHTLECSRSSGLTYDDYLMYAKGNYKRNHASYARKMELRRDPEMDAQVREWIRAKAAADVEAEENETETTEPETAPRSPTAPISDDNEKAEMRKERAKRANSKRTSRKQTTG